MEQQTAKLVYNVGECAELLGLAKNSVYSYLQSGFLLYVRCGRRILIPRAALERLLEHGTAVLPERAENG
jgi:excisionase family DNA binding protein